MALEPPIPRPVLQSGTGDSLFVTPQVKEEWYLWIYFLQENKGSPWKNFSNVFVQANVHSDALGRSFAGVVDVPGGSIN